MSLKPELYPLTVGGTYGSPHTIDIFLDYVCPFSKKMFYAIDRVLKPLVDEGGIYHSKVKIIFRPQVQPWHATSTYTHEAGIAAAIASPKTFYKFALALFERQNDFFDQPCLTLTPVQIRRELSEIAAQVMPSESHKKFVDLLALNPSGANAGVGVTDDLKYTIKFARQNSIHVSPTVLWDGIVASEISSSWGAEEWTAFLKAKVTV